MLRPDRIHAALEKITRKNTHLTRDVGEYGPGEFADTVIANMESVLAAR